MVHITTALLAIAGLNCFVEAADQAPLSDPTNSAGNHHHYDELDPTDAWDVAYHRASNFVSSLTFEEKIHMVTGDSYAGYCVGNLATQSRANFTGLCMSDGPQAVNRADLISIFPSGVTVAATWDKDLMYRRALLMGSEFRGKGINVHLGPVAGPLGRHALGGRNWEGFSPDPYLTGIAMGLTVQGFQDMGVQTSSKHFIGNEQETQRSMSDGEDKTDAISSNIDDKTLHELYLWPFANAIRAGTTSIMCSYNRINGTYACHNKKLLVDILREELGFRGYVVSDWWATHATVEAANSGLDLEMPGWEARYRRGDPWFGDKLEEAIGAGDVTNMRLDEMIENVMTPYFLLDQDKDDYPTVDDSIAWVRAVTKFGWGSDIGAGLPPMVEARDVRAEHAKFIREMGAAAIVLLKNTDNTLPLQAPKTIGVFGNDAGDPADGMYRDSKVKMGTLDIGGGSGSGRHSNIVTPLDAIQEKAEGLGSRVQYVLNNQLLISGETRMIYPKPDVCLVFTKSWAGEGSDRDSLDLDWDGNKLIASVASWCSNTVVVMHAGGVIAMPWADNPNVTAVLAAHYPGEESGHSIVDILWGTTNPSGKLPFTIPKNPEDYQPPVVRKPQADGNWVSDFDEGPMIDYRHFDKNGIEPLYEFGYGLSYTTFEIGYDTFELDLHVSNAGAASSMPNESLGKKPGGWVDLWTKLATAVVPVTNTGVEAGHTVVQLYMSYPDSEDDQPVKILRGFERVYLEPGQSVDVKFPLLRRDLSVWDVKDQEWRLPYGRFTLMAGFSSRDVAGGSIGMTILEK
ncbi:putative beta-glucosidase G [Zalerion maritima]|uniref:Beta-glucosidase cel3A n=1 Tax=Zalerion maritima TaxID=339359 RepID=A0AAD5RIE7_9PEZI|nr:putative beta-glucosidase G [Zalerion maritima]